MKNKLLPYILLIICIIVGIVVWLISFPETYHKDRLIVYFSTPEQANNILLVELTRYSVFPYVYQHQYTAKVINEQTGTEKNQEFKSFSNTVTEKDFVTHFSNDNQYNLLDEDYALEVDIDGNHYSIDLQNLTGDFLINNSLERFTYLNLGTTTITINNRTYDASYSLNKTASTDISKTTLQDDISGSGNSIFLADNQGGVYTIDMTEVDSGAGEYDSHNWTAYKNGHILQKEANVADLTLENATTPNPTLDLVLFNNARITFTELAHLKKRYKTYSLLSGEITDDTGQRLLGGLRMKYEY